MRHIQPHRRILGGSAFNIVLSGELRIAVPEPRIAAVLPELLKTEIGEERANS